MKTNSILVATTALLLCGLLQIDTLADSRIYWMEKSGHIRRANSDGSELTDLVSYSGMFYGLALDVPNEKMYWYDMLWGKIKRANLDGSRSGDVISMNTSTYFLALDVAGGKIYWPAVVPHKIRRVNVDGSGEEDVITSGLIYPWGIALDVPNGKMYWTECAEGLPAKIRRANLDGSDMEDIIASGLTYPWGIALDVSGGKIYWTTASPNRIRCANFDGSEVTDLVTTGTELPYDIALDVLNGKMYWTVRGWTVQKPGKIQRANLDGSGVEDIITGLGDVTGIALEVHEPPIEAEVEITPHTLNLKSKSKWITCYIRLPEEYDVADVNSASVVLEDEIEAAWIWADEETQVVMAKFSCWDIQELLAESGELGDVELTVRGELIDRTQFEGMDIIRIIDKEKKQ